MKRGEIWTCAGGADYAGKPRPVVIVQSDRFDSGRSVTVCPFTTTKADAPLFRIPVQPNDRNGLREQSSLMVDKVTTLPRTKMARFIGRLADEDLLQLNGALRLFLSLEAVPPL